MSNASKKCAVVPKNNKKTQDSSNMQTYSQTSWLNLNGKLICSIKFFFLPFLDLFQGSNFRLCLRPVSSNVVLLIIPLANSNFN